MERTTTVLAAALFVLLAGHSTANDAVANELIGDETARQYGLTRSWFAQVEIDSGRARVAFVTQHVNHARSRVIQEITYQGGKAYFTDSDLDQFGVPVGIEGAERLAQARVRELAVAGRKPILKTLRVPEITLYAQTDNGILHAIDGETGRTRWSTIVGNPDYPVVQPGANNAYVAVANGSTLYVLDASNGRLLWERRVLGSPGAGPALTEDLLYIPMVDGAVEAYGLKENKSPVWTYRSSGATFAPPTAGASSVTWCTERGVLYGVSTKRTGIRFRLNTGGPILSPSVLQSSGRVVAASLDGYVYSVQENTGNISWRFSSGEPISQSPAAVGDAIYVVSDRGSLFRVAGNDGSEVWWTSDVLRFLSASQDRVYALGSNQRLHVINAKTGSKIASMPTGTLDLNIVNHFTDRIYLGTRLGLLQCLRERDLNYPLVYAAEAALSTEPMEAAPMPPAGGGMPAAGPAVDPFAPAPDPFAPAAPAPAPVDPFAPAPPRATNPFEPGGAP
jgi:outer membrane protein assembly factor BamB